MRFEWNEGQKNFLNTFKKFIASDDKVMGLIGSAGVGKTAVLSEAIKGLDGVFGATIAHSARGILQDSLKGIECHTIASLLGLKMNITEDGDIKFIPSKASVVTPIESARLLIVDECSMIDQSIHDLILSMKPLDCKVIFVGDSRQLPPVGEDNDSIVFNYPCCELTQPMRFQGPIYVASQCIREQIDRLNRGVAPDKTILNKISKGRKPMLIGDDGVRFEGNIHKMLDYAVEVFKNSDSSEALRLIAFKNKTISTLNEYIKKAIYGEDARTLEPGMIVTATEPYKRLFKNGKIFIIKDLKEAKVDDIPCFAVQLDVEFKSPVYVIDTDKSSESYRLFKERSSELRSRAMNAAKKFKKSCWVEFYAFTSKFAKLEPSYAQNTHKSQGSTYDQVIVFEEEILSIKPISIKQKYQSLYVAMTRAKRNLYIYNKKY